MRSRSTFLRGTFEAVLCVALVGCTSAPAPTAPSAAAAPTTAAAPNTARPIVLADLADVTGSFALNGAEMHIGPGALRCPGWQHLRRGVRPASQGHGGQGAAHGQHDGEERQRVSSPQGDPSHRAAVLPLTPEHFKPAL